MHVRSPATNKKRVAQNVGPSTLPRVYWLVVWVHRYNLSSKLYHIPINKVNSGIQDDTAEKKRYFYSYVKETAFTHVWLHVEHE
jgi:hypothetical protein